MAVGWAHIICMQWWSQASTESIVTVVESNISADGDRETVTQHLYPSMQRLLAICDAAFSWCRHKSVQLAASRAVESYLLISLGDLQVSKNGTVAVVGRSCMRSAVVSSRFVHGLSLTMTSSCFISAFWSASLKCLRHPVISCFGG